MPNVMIRQCQHNAWSSREMPLNHTELEDRWHRLWRALGAAPAAGAFDYLLMQYSEPGRHYHTLEHIAACLEHFDSWRHLADKPHLVELALWLHDVIYDTHRVDNEACSAQYAITLLTAAGVPEYIPAVEAMIMATNHQTGSQADDCGLVLDIDLAVLAQPPQAYKSYQQAVQQEFAWVPDDLFRAGRADVLRGLLSCHPLYGHPEISAAWEAIARSNIESELLELEGPQSN
ncbi:hypothetical protein QVM41_03205 [Pseudomonas shirazica]